MLLMTKFSNEVSFIDLVIIQIQLDNFKCRCFLGHPLLHTGFPSQFNFCSLFLLRKILSSPLLSLSVIWDGPCWQWSDHNNAEHHLVTKFLKMTRTNTTTMEPSWIPAYWDQCQFRNFLTIAMPCLSRIFISSLINCAHERALQDLLSMQKRSYS